IWPASTREILRCAQDDRAHKSVKPVAANLIREGCFKLADLLVRLIARDSITPLDGAEKLIALTLDTIQIIVGEFSPLFFDAASDLFPSAFHSVPVHYHSSLEPIPKTVCREGGQAHFAPKNSAK